MKLEELQELLNSKEKLCPELKKCIVKGKTFDSLKHPLVFQVPYFPGMDAMHNRSLEKKREYSLECIKKRNWHQYVFIHERPYRLEAFHDIEDQLDDVAYWKLVREIWTDSENTWQNLTTWRKIFRQNRAGKAEMMTSVERGVLNDLPDEVEVYRGCGNKNKHGIAWTLDKAKAVWFANRYKQGGFVRTEIVHKSSIVAYFASRGESEVIVL